MVPGFGWSVFNGLDRRLICVSFSTAFMDTDRLQHKDAPYPASYGISSITIAISSIFGNIDPMTFDQFKASLQQNAPPAALNTWQQSLWHAAKGNWNQAHELIQDLPDRVSAHIHAYLHRVEGDQWNADYWYSRAGQKSTRQPLQEEWETIVKSLL